MLFRRSLFFFFDEFNFSLILPVFWYVVVCGPTFVLFKVLFAFFLSFAISESAFKLKKHLVF
jgi:hypothetical protein